jgi:hypothetical protein
MNTRKKKLEAHNAATRQKNKQIEVPYNDRFCGNCARFEDEDARGLGNCEFHKFLTGCGMWCEDWVDNLKITQK